jgi:Fic family protein
MKDIIIKKVNKVYLTNIKTAHDNPISYSLTNTLSNRLNLISELSNKINDDYIPKDLKDDLKYKALIYESLYSASMECGYQNMMTIIEMFNENKQPINLDQMKIKNIFDGYNFAYSFSKIDKLTNQESILKLWDILTNNTLDKKQYLSEYSKISNSDIAERITDMFKQLDKDTTQSIIINASIIQYYFEYTQPFNQVNGSLSRILIYLYLIHNEVDIIKYFSISELLLKNLKQYKKIMQNCKTNNNDITLFLEFFSKIILKTLTSNKLTYLNDKTPTIINNLLKDANIKINSRQLLGIKKIFESDFPTIDIDIYQRQFDISRSTAYKDLTNFLNLGILKQKKNGKKNIYVRNGFLEIIRIFNENYFNNR